ncbi:hypothetical protein HPB51_010451 [Rhipicephalus microplus]|uniref:Uncharacterized protein n=1 Tax=Rhipicephalus microplus TaxID=6941 RepID=A0A9J6E0M9_RHIMP|nr:hypothetical protein HPB51_010451 [Rhipicephalus microplus]
MGSSDTAQQNTFEPPKLRNLSLSRLQKPKQHQQSPNKAFFDEVSPSRGEAWPRPMNQTTSDHLILLNPNTFDFVFAGPSGGCDIAHRALKRYRHKLLFRGCAAPRGFDGGQRRVPPRSAVDGVPVAVLNSLLVRLNGPCERIPHHDMDESYCSPGQPIARNYLSSAGANIPQAIWLFLSSD